METYSREEFIRDSILKWKRFLFNVNRKEPIDYITAYWNPCGFCSMVDQVNNATCSSKCVLYPKWCQPNHRKTSVASDAINCAKEHNFKQAKILATKLINKMRRELKRKIEDDNNR
jgi:hypothetical protein